MALTGDPASFGETLRRVRTLAGMSQEALAERAGLSTRGVGDLERGARRRPHPETVRLIADALSLEGSERQALFAAARPEHQLHPPAEASVNTGLLPAPLTPLVGRQRELAELPALLRRADVRLVSLTGPGGSGKTRLALEVADRLRAEFADGVVFVDLTPLSDPALVIPRIAEALGIRERPGEPITATLADRLASKRMLVVLDNIEHLLEATAIIPGLLAACPGLRILATSRESLRLRGEWVFPLSPLELPERIDAPAIELAHVPAVTLFVERAVATDPAFNLSETNAAAIAGICARLDGLPLAIELAAARIRVLPPEVLVTRLQRRLPLLTGGARDLPDRQRTLRDTIAWSHGLLSDDERRLFRRLAVFVGEWTLQSAEAVANVDGQVDVLVGVEALFDKSLIRQTARHGAEARFAMLETIREFAQEKLHDAVAEEVAIQRAHAAYFSNLAIDALRDLGRGESSAVATIRTEQDNLRAMLAWLIESGEAETALRVMASLSEYWALIGGQFSEGRAWLDRALALGAAASPVARAYGLYGLALMAIYQGETVTAQSAAAEALALARAADDVWTTVGALHMLSTALSSQGRVAEALSLAREAVRLARAMDDPEWQDWTLFLLGVGLHRSGDLAAARSTLEEAVALARRIDDRWCEADVTNYLGLVAGDQGDLAFAARLHTDALAYRLTVGAQPSLAWALVGLADLAAQAGQLETATLLIGASEAHSGRYGSGLFHDLPTRAERLVAEARKQLGEQRFMEVWESGVSLTTDDMVGKALALADELAPA